LKIAMSAIMTRILYKQLQWKNLSEHAHIPHAPILETQKGQQFNGA
jgi:hypothetical protein